MSNIYENSFCLKLADAILNNFNDLLKLSSIDISNTIDFELIVRILDEFVKQFYVLKDKTDKDYEKGKRNFSKVLLCNYKFLKDNFDLSLLLSENDINNFFKLFEDGLNKNWITLLFIIVSYISFVKHSDNDTKINYSGMIDKLTKKVEEYNREESEREESDREVTDREVTDREVADREVADREVTDREVTDREVTDREESDRNTTNKGFANNFGMQSQNLLNQLREHLPQTNNNSNNNSSVMKNLLGDIKGLLNNDTLDTSDILGLSKNLGEKYESMIEKGDLNIMDLFGGVVDLLNNPSSLETEFADIDSSRLPNPNDLINQMSTDPKLKEAMSMMNNLDSKGGMDMSMLGTMMSSLMGNNVEQQNTDEPQTINELEREIERMMDDLDKND